MSYFEIPVRLSAGPNQRLHWAERMKIVKRERHAVAFAFPKKWATWLEELPQAEWVVLLTRIAPRDVDDDNLAGLFKATRDEVAKQLGLKDDRDPRITWRYTQFSAGEGNYGVRVCLTTLRAWKSFIEGPGSAAQIAATASPLNGTPLLRAVPRLPKKKRNGGEK